MPSYNSQAASIQRQRALAEALRATGNEAIAPSIRTGGRFDAPVSGWEYGNKALSTLLGAYENVQADKKQKALDAEDKAVLAQVIAAKRNAQPEGNVASSEDPVANSVMASSPLRGELAPEAGTQDERTARLQAAALRGQQFGGSAAPYAQEITNRELFPAETSPYTLTPGDKRFDKNNKVVAEGGPQQFRETADDRQLINIVDAKNGFKTIKRSDWNGEKLYEKPNAGATMASQLTGNALDLAAEKYRVEGKLPTGLGRSPDASMKIIKRAAELADMNGDNARAAVLRQQFQGAAKTALGRLTTQQTMVGAFEKTAKNSLKLAQDLSHKVDRAGVPVVDRWLQAGKKNIAGDADVAAFHAANETFVSEYAKIMSGSMGNTAVSDATRQHARDLLATAMTQEQYDSVVNTLTQEMNGRIASFPAQVSELMGQLSGTDNPTTPGAKPDANVVDFSSLK